MKSGADMSVMTVTALNEYIRSITAKDAALSDILISGELSGFTRHISGHCFFTLKDDASQIKGIMFSGVASKLPYEPKNGMYTVRCTRMAHMPLVFVLFRRLLGDGPDAGGQARRALKVRPGGEEDGNSEKQ